MNKATQLRNDIAKAKKKLTNRAIRSGLWENFGQAEVSKIEGKYNKLELTYGDDTERAMSNEIEAFNNWCINFNDSDLK